MRKSKVYFAILFLLFICGCAHMPERDKNGHPLETQDIYGNWHASVWALFPDADDIDCPMDDETIKAVEEIQKSKPAARGGK